MAFNLVNQVGEWNPQLFREIKGRLKPRNILIAVTVSFLGQMLLLMSFATQLPVTERVIDSASSPISSRYCLGVKENKFAHPFCQIDSLGAVSINWQLWWQDVFIWMSLLGSLILLVVGTYMLISDLSKEEQKGTLNFLRLTPQSSQSILIGKMLGVPIILYLVGLVAFPLHLAAGLLGNIPLGMMLGAYTVVGASCLFFYSMALLFGLSGTWLGGFQAWLAAGTVLMYLWVMTTMVGYGPQSINQNPGDWLMLFSPSFWIGYLNGNWIDDFSRYSGSSVSTITQLKMWGIPVGKSALSMLGVMLLNYAIWTYWAWVGLKRCFHNPKSTLFGKQQSYWLMACFEVAILGFALEAKVPVGQSYQRAIFHNFQMLLLFNLIVFLGFIAALSPQRQAMQDWARFRHQQHQGRKRGVMADLIWGEKSPVIVAIALNAAIASSMLFTWIMFWSRSDYKLPAIFALVVNMSLILLYAAVTQLMLLMKSPKRAALAAASVGALIAVPPLMLAILSRRGDLASDLWLFSAFPWVYVEKTSAMAVFFAMISQSLATGLLTIKLTRQLRKAGESSTKALLSGRSTVAAD
jgi:hypothetical protein